MKKFIYIAIILVVGYFFIDSIYTQMNKDKTPGLAKRLACQEKVTSFERAFDDSEIVLAQKQVESQTITFTSRVEKATYMETNLFNHISLEQTDEIFVDEMNKYFKEKREISAPYKFSYYIYENDKKDPGKKGKKSKLYAGYVVFDVKNNNNKAIYKSQIDFMDLEGKDLEQSLRCTIQSFMTYKK